MQIDQNSLKELLKSAYGPTCATSLIDKIQAGGTIEITMDDTTIVTLTEVKEAKRFLKEAFGWIA